MPFSQSSGWQPGRKLGNILASQAIKHKDPSNLQTSFTSPSVVFVSANIYSVFLGLKWLGSFYYNINPVTHITPSNVLLNLFINFSSVLLITEDVTEILTKSLFWNQLKCSKLWHRIIQRTIWFIYWKQKPKCAQEKRNYITKLILEPYTVPHLQFSHVTVKRQC